MRRRKSRPQASLTATHSSTLAEEIVSVLRALHYLAQWNGMINDYINAQLSSIGDVIAGCQSEAVSAVLWKEWRRKESLTWEGVSILAFPVPLSGMRSGC